MNVTIVSSGGVPMTLSPGNGPVGFVVPNGGIPVTIVVGAVPFAFFNPDGSPWTDEPPTSGIGFMAIGSTFQVA